MPVSDERAILSAVIIDDDAAIRDLVGAVLISEGYVVSPFAEGKLACEALERGELYPTVIVLDMMMPGMHGLDVLTRVKLRPNLAKIPVIMLTAESAPQDMMNGYAQGADYYITKPFTRQQLVFGLGVVAKKE
jgi:two-component system alkaline phosphatase synthesis response regulator PhoP